MAKHQVNGTALAAVAAVALVLASTAAAQTGTAPERVGDSASLSSGAPITAPGTVDAGQTVDVLVDETPQGASIELWGPVTQDGRGERIATAPVSGGAAQLTAPAAPGSYELRYVDASGRQLGRRAFDVAAVPVTLSVPTPVVRGGVMDVTWQGPGRPGDRFEIVSAAGAAVDATPVAGDASGRNVSQVATPAEPGTYELRYVTGDGAVLRWVRFDVE